MIFKVPKGSVEHFDPLISPVDPDEVVGVLVNFSEETSLVERTEGSINERQGVLFHDGDFVKATGTYP